MLYLHCMVIFRPQPYPFRGSMTRPASLFHPTPYSRYRVCTWISLPDWIFTHWATSTNFLEFFSLLSSPKVSDLSRHDHAGLCCFFLFAAFYVCITTLFLELNDSQFPKIDDFVTRLIVSFFQPGVQYRISPFAYDILSQIYPPPPGLKMIINDIEKYQK